MLPGSLTYKPPSAIGNFIVSEFTKLYFFWLFFPPHHRKYLINFETYSVIVFGARRKDAWKIGKNESTDFIRMSFPALLGH